MFGMGMFEVMVIGVIAVLLFGKQLPDVARNFGKTYFQFRESLNDIQREIRDVGDSVKSTINTPSTPTITYEPDEAVPPSGRNSNFRTMSLTTTEYGRIAEAGELAAIKGHLLAPKS